MRCRPRRYAGWRPTSTGTAPCPRPTGPGSASSPRPASRRSSRGCATPPRAGRGPDQQVTADVFGSAPRELTWSVTLAQTLDLIRTVIDVVEREILRLASPGDEAALREAVLRYSGGRLLRGPGVRGGRRGPRRVGRPARVPRRRRRHPRGGRRVHAVPGDRPGLGLGRRVAVVVGSTPSGATAAGVNDLHRAAPRASSPARRHPRAADHLHRRQRRRPSRPCDGARPATSATGRSSSVRPSRTSSPRAAAPARPSPATARPPPGPPHHGPVHADDLLAERPCSATFRREGRSSPGSSGPSPRAPAARCSTRGGRTSTATSGSEGTARALIVHPNTVRYRLAGITKAIGYDLTDAHDAQTVRTASPSTGSGPRGARHTPALSPRSPLEESSKTGRPRFVRTDHEPVTVTARLEG